MSETLPTPAFDSDVLARLALDVQDAACATMFATRYRQMLAGRLGRIDASLLDGDADAALDAVLSLKVASSTVGTCQLANLAAAVEVEVRRGDLPAAAQLAEHLRTAGATAEEALTAYLGD